MSVLDSFGKCPREQERARWEGQKKETQGSEMFQQIYRVRVNSRAKEQ